MIDQPATPTWYVLTLAVEPDLADDIADGIRDLVEMEPVQLDRPGGAHTWLELYFEHDGEIASVADRIRKEFPVLASEVRSCTSRDWHAFWQLHFKAHHVGRRLTICPAWEAPGPGTENRVVVRIVPGLSFGTGEHFTTRFCLEMIDRLAPPGPCRTLWDVGCGSGILAVAGALLGMDSVLGTDNDPVCLAQAAENATLNEVSGKTVWRTGDITGDAGASLRYDAVCANLYASLLVRSAAALWGATGQYLALSGIREFEVDHVAETFIRMGAREVVRDGDGDWAGLLFQRV